MRAYLDIETTFGGAISVIGMYRSDLGTIQLVGAGVRDLSLYEALDGVQTLVTFNGSTFDLPVIRRCLVSSWQVFRRRCRSTGNRYGKKGRLPSAMRTTWR